jgi:hypothetical protein
MPKRARYPVFLLGLAIILLGGIFVSALGAPATVLAALVAVGFSLLFLAVAIK